METGKQGFATFIGSATLGRKLGAILSWVAAVALLVALFVPFANFEYGAADTSAPLSSIDDVLDKFSAGEPMDKVYEEFEISGSEYAAEQEALAELFSADEHSVSLFNYCTAYCGAVTGSSVVGYVLLAVYVVLVAAIIIFGLFTMNILSVIAVIGAAVEAMIVYFLHIADAVSVANDAGYAINASLSVLVIILLIAAVVLTIVGVILHFAVGGKETEEPQEDFDWGASDDTGRDIETGLTEDSTQTTTDMPTEPINIGGNTVTAQPSVAPAPAPVRAGVLVQLNTQRAYDIMDNSETVIGKSKDANIIIQNPVVSRTHAKMICQNGSVVLQDLNSSNGTYVGDKKLDPGTAVALLGGEYITLANEMFQFTR